MELKLEFRVQLLGGACFFGVDCFHPALEAAEPDLGAADLAAIEPQGRSGQPGEERPVMRNRDECASVSPEPILKPVDGGEVEMVGRLVEKEDIRIHG